MSEKTEISADLIARMVTLVRRMNSEATWHWNGDYDEARAIVALLPPPVDPDVQIVRDMLADEYLSRNYDDPEHATSWAGFMRDGSYDDDRPFRNAFAALKRGRELAAGGAA